MSLPKPFIAAVGLLAIGTIAGLGAGLHFNHTASYPRGLWIETNTSETNRPYVLACADHTADFELYKDRRLPALGLCLFWYRELLSNLVFKP